jgi:hypothetical protein
MKGKREHKLFTRTVIFVVLLFVSVFPAGAATLSDYHKRLDSARMDVIALRRLDDEPTSFFRLKNTKLEEIRRSVPKNERIEWQGGSVDTSNQWLYDDLDAYLNETDDPQRRRTMLLGIEERLSALGEKIDEIEKATAATRTKDEDKQKLAEILQREEFQKPEVKEESLFQKWWREFLEWIANLFPHDPVAPGAGSNFGSLQLVLQILIYAAVLGAIGFLVYRFWPQLAGGFGLKTKEKKRDRVILGERIGEDESAADLFDDAERLAREGQPREAIRKGYIALLCDLSDRKIIGLARHKTNRDYLRDVRRRPRLYENMSGVTGNYERNWYGLRPSQQDDWEDFRDKYRQTMASAKI